MIADVEKRLEGKIDNLGHRLALIPTFMQMIVLVGGALAVGVGTFLGVVQYGGDRFDGGVNFTASTYSRAEDAQRLAEKNAEQIENLIKLMARQNQSKAPPK